MKTNAAPHDDSAPLDDDDAALVVRIADGDKHALSLLYDRYAGLMLGIALRIAGARGEAEDLIHDVFLEVWRRAGDFDPKRGTARAWLLLRTRSRAIDRRKSPRLSRAVSWDDIGGDDRAAPDAPDAMLAAERERVRAALASLSREHRVVVELAYFQGLSMGEIASQIECPVGTVKSRLFAAREKLKGAIIAAGGAP